MGEPERLRLAKVVRADWRNDALATILSGDEHEDPIPLDPAEIPADGHPSACSEWDFDGQDRLRVLVDVPGGERSGIVHLRLLAKGRTVCGLTWENKDGKGSWAVRRDLPNKAFISIMDGDATVSCEPEPGCSSNLAAQVSGGDKVVETKANW